MQTLMGLIGALGLLTFFCVEVLYLTRGIQSRRKSKPDVHADVQILLGDAVTNRPQGDPTIPIAEYAAVNEARYQIIQARRK